MNLGVWSKEMLQTLVLSKHQNRKYVVKANNYISGLYFMNLIDQIYLTEY